MYPTRFVRAAAQYKWHKHIPLIKFVGPRKDLWSRKAAKLRAEEGGPRSVSASASTTDGTGALEFWQLPPRYRPPPLTESEIEAIESGGASLRA
ncbi:hypothetical protein EV182_000590 [Spiromyces aspiralis]|uniref:Uncharacterized protein n=1 Tax=Spiromyces aspiralis TaxID=68401 RepID=A0ACC1HJ57_9FUNG|nr:hypothetical protein EV182_000590 [Spiromyces aspiralis]